MLDKKIIDTIYLSRRIDEICNLTRGYKNIYLVFDNKIDNGFINKIKSCLSIVASYSIEATEDNKSLDTVSKICHWLIQHNVDRSALLIGCGGGITTDIVGFVASIYKRKIDFAFIPTTLLAQVDASIGGKNGVNFDCYKNMVGTINQPVFTFIYPEILNTLPKDVFNQGASELIKTFIINNIDNKYNSSIIQIGKYNRGEACSDAFADLIFSAAKIKAEIVEKDYFDKGERQKLNLGHTFAHAIEWKAMQLGYDISHGNAVAMGIRISAKISSKIGFCDKILADKIIADLMASGLPTESPFPLIELYDAIIEDKKVNTSKINLILIKDIGDVIIEKIDLLELKKLLK